MAKAILQTQRRSIMLFQEGRSHQQDETNGANLLSRRSSGWQVFLEGEEQRSLL